MKFAIVSFIAALVGVVSANPVDSTFVIEPTVLPNNPPNWPPRPSSSSSSTSTTFEISITTLPPHTSTAAPAACPTVTHTTRPSNCEPMQCPVPGCTVQKELFVPCGCKGVKTALFVDGCQTACPEGCITRLRTATALCATPTPF